jgi:hypothetical protein
MRALITCDSGEVVAGIVDFVVSQHASLRLLSRALARAEDGPLAVVLIVLNGLRCYVGVYPEGQGSAVVAARRLNERRAVAALKQMMPERQWTELVVAWRFVHVARAIARLSRTILRDCTRTVKLARVLRRRYGVFRALRIVELFAYYRRYCELLAERPLELAVMSSHSNPHGIALNLASARFGVPIVLITHGMPVLPIARLDYGLAIVECEASRHIYEAAACRMDYVVVKSRKRDWSPMRVPVLSGGLQVGVFLSKDPVEERVVSCVQALLTDVRVTDVRVRPHPVNLWPGLAGRIASFGDDRVRLLSAQSLDAGLRECDLLLAGNSTVLLDALVAGCPACYVRGLDHGPYDVQGFVRDGLVCELAQPSAIDYDAIAGFYRRDGWPRVLRHYADIDRDDIEVGQAVRAAVKRMITDDRYERGVA